MGICDDAGQRSAMEGDGCVHVHTIVEMTGEPHLFLISIYGALEHEHVLAFSFP